MKKRLIQVALAVLTVFFWERILGLKVAPAVLGSLLIHGWGHIIAAKKYGINLSMILTPVGALEYPTDHQKFKEMTGTAEVRIAFGGPLAGLLPLGGLFLLGGIADPIWYEAAYYVALIHVFNLIPIYPLDGGRIFYNLFRLKLRRFNLLITVIVMAAISLTAGLITSLSIGNLIPVAVSLLGVGELSILATRFHITFRESALMRLEFLLVTLVYVLATIAILTLYL